MVDTVSFLDVLNSSITSVDRSFCENVNKQKIYNYFNSTQNSPSKENDKFDFIEKRLRYIAENPLRLQINQNQLQLLLNLSSDADIVDIITAYYSCFYLSPIYSKLIVEKRTALLNQLLCAAYDDIIADIIKENLPSYENLAQHLIFLSETNTKCTLRQIVMAVAEKYKLKIEDIIFYFKNRVQNPKSFERWPEEFLNKYMQIKQYPLNASLQDFLNENNLHDLFNDNDIKKYSPLFDSYVSKLVNGQIGKFETNQIAFSDPTVNMISWK